MYIQNIIDKFATLQTLNINTMAITMSILNSKGGVAKTTTCYNLGVSLWNLGKRVLLIDTDAQCNLTGLIGFDPTEGDSTIYEWLIDDEKNIPIYELYPGLFYIPSSKKMRDIESLLMNKRAREMVLEKKISFIKEKFDYVLIDCSPKEGLINDNAMCASDYVLIPTECSGFSLQGMQNLLLSISDIKENLNGKLDILGFLLTKYDRNTRISKQVTEYFEEAFQGKVFKTKIRKNIKFDETPLRHKGIFEYSPDCNGAEDYMTLGEEITGELRPENWKERAANAWEEAHQNEGEKSSNEEIEQ